MNIEGHVKITYFDSATGKVLEQRELRNTNTNWGKWLLMEKINNTAVSGTSLPEDVATNAAKYEIAYFAVGSDSAVTDVSKNSLNAVIPITDVADPSKYILFERDAANATDEFTDYVDGNIDANVDVTDGTSYKDYFYLKKLESVSYVASAGDSISYQLRIEQDEIVDGSGGSDFTLNEFGLYAVPFDDPVAGTIDTTLPKILFARLTDSYTKSNTVGIVLEWIVKLT